jgi:uncharacterized alkaline shock family protein YloU
LNLEENTEFGKIEIKRGAVARIIRKTLREFPNAVFLSNKAGKISKLSTASNFFELDGDALKIYLVFRIGTPMNAYAKKIGESVRGDIEKMIGGNVHIQIAVKGFAKGETIKRQEVIIDV